MLSALIPGVSGQIDDLKAQREVLLDEAGEIKEEAEERYEFFRGTPFEGTTDFRDEQERVAELEVLAEQIDEQIDSLKDQAENAGVPTALVTPVLVVAGLAVAWVLAGDN